MRNVRRPPSERLSHVDENRVEHNRQGVCVSYVACGHSVAPPHEENETPEGATSWRSHRFDAAKQSSLLDTAREGS